MKHLLITLLVVLGLASGSVTATADSIPAAGQDVIEQNINNIFNPYQPADHGARK
ncbi:hypothetical protein [Marinobacterium arenosum]|uniref:hypothetical protein n=1 Tax=Marinobacterium arenosum TaxID=2862496 RepID=UPI001C939A93|nr:hypothetical protein [Marinobacterium arenosum]MBY4677424.1 hypothetical protein [Marinobacterium arenosum]